MSSPADKAYGVGAALAIGLGSIIGGSVFATTGQALQGAGGAAPLAYLFGALPAYITAYSYIRMARAHPGSGGTMAYFNMGFGGGYLSAGLNLLLVVCYAGVAALYAGVFGTYAAELFHWHHDTAQRIMSCLGIAVFAIVNLSSNILSSRIQPAMNACKFLVMSTFILVALLSPLWDWGNFAPSHRQPTGSVLITGLTIFMSYQGFELMAAIRHPFRTPTRTLPTAMILCLSIVTLYYCAVAFCTVGNVDYATAGRESPYLLSAVAERIMGSFGHILLCLGAVIASASAMNADIFSVSAIPEAMAEEREMPAFFLPSHAESRTQGIIFLGILLILFVNLLSIQELTAISSLGFLSIYALANAVSLRITPRTRASVILSTLGTLVCTAAAIAVAWQLFTSDHSILLIATTTGMLALPFIWQGVYYHLHRRR